MGKRRQQKFGETMQLSLFVTPTSEQSTPHAPLVPLAPVEDKHLIRYNRGDLLVWLGEREHGYPPLCVQVAGCEYQIEGCETAWRMAAASYPLDVIESALAMLKEREKEKRDAVLCYARAREWRSVDKEALPSSLMPFVCQTATHHAVEGEEKWREFMHGRLHAAYSVICRLY